MKQGDTAPDFSLADDKGEARALADFLATGPVVLFFFPIASSSGCTVEACHFRDLAQSFAALGAQRIGISPDDVAAQLAFVNGENLDFPLLADVDGQVSEQFGVKRSGLLAKMGPVKRKTFVIGTDRTILAVIGGEMKFRNHADEALAVLKAAGASA
ncbi:MAG: peroxiredoxin [Mycobacteriaceae bacterium]